jgi:hypothetical protein
MDNVSYIKSQYHVGSSCDNVSYVNFPIHAAGSRPFGEDALSSESQPSSDADNDDTESSDYDSDPPKILLDKKLIAYVKKLEKNHTVYIEKYSTLRGSHKKCSKSVSLDYPALENRRRANTGVLRLLERKKTKVRQTHSIPVNIETVCQLCHHNQTSKLGHPSHEVPKPCYHCQAPKACLSEQSYLKII